jgi:peptidyl-tRNA hydrolase, PTH1 family
MKLIVGLGNPGKKYENTRHNIGFIIIDALQKELEASDFKLNKKFQAEITEINLGKEKIILAKPQTYMNKSGQAVKAIKNFYKIPLREIIVIRDDLDMAFGKYREKRNSSSGGHNGINSIIENLGSQKFLQIKIGVRNKDIEKMDSADFVLQNFIKTEMAALIKFTPGYVEKLLQMI